MSQPDYTSIWLPRYFIKIGIGTILLSIVLMVTVTLLYNDVRAEFGNHTTEIMKASFLNIIILGLTLITFSRYKKEDETSVRKRLTGILAAFFTGIAIVLISPLFDIFSPDTIEVIDSRQLIIIMLVMSIAFKYSAKKDIEKQ